MSRSVEDLVGQTFGLLTVISNEPKRKNIRMCRCRCVCGRYVITRCSSLKNGHTKGCGQRHRVVHDMTGERFGKLIVESRAPDHITPSGNKSIMWNCVCDCGNRVVVRGTNLRNGNSSSCGCTRSESLLGSGLIDISGKRFGRWTVIGPAGRVTESRGRKVMMWRCRCDCGTERNIAAGTLQGGLSLSCGCYKLEKLQKQVAAGTRSSIAEKIVNAWLTKQIGYLISGFVPQKYYADLRGKLGYPLSYDFLVYKNDKPVLLIECQGEQHYHPITYFGGEVQFKVQQENDRQKSEYAKKIDIPLLCIPYTIRKKDNIIQLVKDQL